MEIEILAGSEVMRSMQFSFKVQAGRDAKWRSFYFVCVFARLGVQACPYYVERFLSEGTASDASANSCSRQRVVVFLVLPRLRQHSRHFPTFRVRITQQ